jgi:outer membrane protein TolC
MIRRTMMLIGLLAAGLAQPALAQTRLTLGDAIARARTQNLDARTAELAQGEARERVTQARAGYLPKVDLAETWQRGDQPVFVFSSLLAQRDFAASNFAIDALNHPPATDNFRLALMVEQALFDPATGSRIKAADLGHQMAIEQRGRVAQDLAVAVTETFGQVLSAAAAVRAAEGALKAAEADREIARNRRDAGRVTDADVLQFDVLVARSREQRIRAVADEHIARAHLNRALGEPLDAVFELDAAPEPGLLAGEPAALESEALTQRADLKLAGLREQLAGAAVDAARSGFLPHISAQGGWEANGGDWNDRASSWLVGVSARINLFQGFADRARLTEAQQRVTRLALEREQAEIAARLEVRTARARLDAARAADEVVRATAAQALESRRIIRDRYEAGLADVSALLRAADAVDQAEARQTAAQVEVLTATAALARALGR